MEDDGKKVRVRSREGDEVCWSRKAARRAQTLKDCLEDTDGDGSFVASTLTTAAVHTLAAMCDEQGDDGHGISSQHVASCSIDELGELIRAAIFLDAAAALGVVGRELLARLVGKTDDERRALLGAEDDLTGEEKTAAREEPLFVPPGDAPPPQQSAATGPPALQRSLSTALANDDAIREALRHADVGLLRTLKPLSRRWRERVRALLCERLCSRPGQALPTRLCPFPVNSPSSPKFRCHCARRRPHISRWTSETAAVDLQPTVCPAVSPHWHRTQKANRSRAVSISQPGGQRPQLRGLPRSGKAPVMLLIAKSNSNVELSANDNHID